MKEKYITSGLIAIVLLLLLAISIFKIYPTEEDNININEYGFANNMIPKKIKYFKDKYDISVKVLESPDSLNEYYDVSNIYDYELYMNALNSLEDFLIPFNKTFFNRFKKDGMDGVEIYFSSIINGNKNGYENASVAGIYYMKDSKYNIVIELNNSEDVKVILAHEFMHLMENYLKIYEYDLNDWNTLNKADFKYFDIYYANAKFDDTLSKENKEEEIYFIDNYARSSKEEDRTRIFEAIYLKKDYSNYPNINKKINYLKTVINEAFPELKNLF